jgi:iron complex outermembrane receptor protein
MDTVSGNMRLLCAAGSLLLATHALAQGTPGAAQRTSADAPVRWELEEVIVSARKRDESILKVPVIETVISEESLSKTNSDDVYAVTNFVPGFLIGSGIVSQGPLVSFRGIGTTANNATVDQSVSLNIDGQQFSQGMAYGMAMFDTKQIEVLKGPQALFFGKNSPAGVISIRSADPTDKFEVIARVGYESDFVWTGSPIPEASSGGPIHGLRGLLSQ